MADSFLQPAESENHFNLCFFLNINHKRIYLLLPLF